MNTKGKNLPPMDLTEKVKPDVGFFNSNNIDTFKESHIAKYAGRPDGEAINLLLRDHEEAIGDWQHQGLVKDLYVWTEIFQFEFKLKLPHPVVGFEKLRCTTLANYQRGRSGMGTKYTIILNNLFLKDPVYRILRRLLHELIHCFEELYGLPRQKKKKKHERSWYHSKFFINKAAECGILTNSHGYDLGHTVIFSALLHKYGVDAPDTEGEPCNEENSNTPDQKTSTLKKWSCGCTNVWAAVELYAHCLECGEDFQKADKKRR